MDGAGDIEVWSGGSDEDPVTLVTMGSMVVLDGPQELVARMVAADPVLNERQVVTSSSAPVVGALSSLATAVGSAGGGSQTFRLDPASLQAFKNGALAKSSEGGFRLFQQGSGGQIASQGSLTPVSLGPEQMLSAQMAMVTVALMAAIKDVQAAVERVQTTVDLLRDHLEAERVGRIGGLNAKLRRVADEVARSGALSSVDWDEISSAATDVDQQVVEMRAFVAKRLRTAEAEGDGLAGRVEALDHLRLLGEALTLLLVAEDNQLLYEQLRLHRVRSVEPGRLADAIEAASKLLEAGRRADQRLVNEVRQATADRVGVRELEIHRVFTTPKLVDSSTRIDALLGGFADQRALRYDAVEIPERPGLDDAADELRARARAGGRTVAGAAQGGRRAIGDALARRRDGNNEGEAADPRLPAGETRAGALTAGDEDAFALMVDPDARSREGRRRRLGRRRSTDDLETAPEADGEPDP